MSVPGSVAVRTEKRIIRLPMVSADVLQSEHRLQCRRVRLADRGVQRHEGTNLVAQLAQSSRTNAPTTSARPPVFANGMISELKIHSFNAAMIGSLTKRLAQRTGEKPCRRCASVAPLASLKSGRLPTATRTGMRHAARNNTGRYVSRLTSGTLAVVMAGGRGERLKALTQHRCKPATPFGGKFRIIDFVLSNCVNSGIRQIAVLTQYKAQSLIQHIQRGWSYLRGEFGEFVEIIPAQQQNGAHWYRGTADSVYQNIEFIRSHNPTHVLMLAGDHIYKMDYGPMIAYHEQCEADITVGVVDVPLERAQRIRHPDHRRHQPGDQIRGEAAESRPHHRPRDMARASMGIYVIALDGWRGC